MIHPRVVVIGAGAMGGSMAGALSAGGADVTIIDTDAAHVAAISANGVAVEGLAGAPFPILAEVAAANEHWADLALIMTPTYETTVAARTAARVLKPDGAALTCQNGLGNYEILVEALGAERVFLGSTKASADRPAPGCPRITKLDPTTLGEADGTASARADWLAATFTRGGMPTLLSDNIMGVLWSKFIHNCCINAISAITGLRMGEATRVPGLGRLRWTLVEEALAVARAKGVVLADPNPVATIQPHVWRKFTQPSMLQHIEQRRPIEIEAINGYLVAEARRLGVAVPVNEAVTALARGRALAVTPSREGADYAALTAEAEAEIDRGETPWTELEETP